MEVKVISSEVLDRIITEEQLLVIYNISLEDWEVEKKIINTWEIGAKTPDGTLAVTPLFQIIFFTSLFAFCFAILSARGFT